MCYRSGRLGPSTCGSREQQSDFECRLLCCKCSYCHRVATKERLKSQCMSNLHRNKICERCFLCRSLVFCKSCHQCPTCCYRSACRGQVTAVLGEMGNPGFKSKSGKHTEGGLHSPLPVQTPLDKVTDCNKQLPQSNQTVLPFRGTVSADKQKSVEPVENQKSLGFYNRLFLVPKPNNRWRPILDLSTLNTFLNTGSFKMETPETIRTSLQAGEWVTSIDFKDAYFHIPIHSQSRVRFHLQGRSYQFKALPFGLSTAPMEFTVVAKEVKLMELQKGIRIHQYLDDWLVRASTHDTCLQHTQTLVTLCQELGWLVNREKSELVPQQVFNFVGYQFDLKEGRVRPTEERCQTLTDKIRSILSDPVCPVRQFMSLIGLLTATEKQVHLGRLHMRPIQWHLEKQLEGPRITRKGDPCSQIPPPSSKVVAGGRQCATRSTITPSKTCSANIYRRIKRRVGRSLRRAHCKGNLVPTREQVAHKPLGAESSISSSKAVSNPRPPQDSVDSYRQHNSGCLYQQRGGDEIGLPVCPTVENTVLVYQAASNSQGTSHPRPAERDSRQAIQAWPDHSNRVVTSSRSVPSCMLQVAPATSGPVCHQVQQQTATVCITSTRPPGLGSGCTQPLLGGPGPIRLPTGSHLGQSGGEAPGLPLQQNNSDCSRVAQHALVLGSGSNAKPDSTVSAQYTQPNVSAIQPGPSQEPVEPEPACLAPRASAIKEQGFSEAVAARIEAPQRGSTRSVYEAKWTIFTKWCLSNQVDVRARSYNQALLMATDQPLLTNWAIPPLMSAKMRISLVSWIVSIETDLRAGGASPPGTFPWFYSSSQRLPLNP